MDFKGDSVSCKSITNLESDIVEEVCFGCEHKVLAQSTQVTVGVLVHL